MWVAIHVHVGGDSWLTMRTGVGVQVGQWVAYGWRDRLCGLKRCDAAYATSIVWQ